MTRARLLPSLLLLAACSSDADIALTIRVPTGDASAKLLLSALGNIVATASRNDVTLAQTTFAASDGVFRLGGISHGPSTILSLDGLDTAKPPHTIAHGSTCPFDFETAGIRESLYFAPTNFLAATVGMPLVARLRPVAMSLGDGSVILAAGTANGAPLASAELFSPASATFTSTPASLSKARARAEAVPLPSVGMLVVGGVDATGNALDVAEVYVESQQTFLSIASPLLARVGHRLVQLPDDRVYVSGGVTVSGATFATGAIVQYSGGTYDVSQGWSLETPRSDHFAVYANGAILVGGGHDQDGAPLDSIERIDPASDPSGTAVTVARMQVARAAATASVFYDATTGANDVLIAGGVDANGDPLDSAEVYNTTLGTTTLFLMRDARTGHAATVLGAANQAQRVLVTGGYDKSGAALDSVELFDVTKGGFLQERSLLSPRGDHVAVTLCDGTVLIVGGAADAEIYTAAAE